MQDISLAIIKVAAVVVQLLNQIIGKAGKDSTLKVCDLLRDLQGLEAFLVSSGMAILEGCDDFNAPYVFICDLVWPQARS